MVTTSFLGLARDELVFFETQQPTYESKDKFRDRNVVRDSIPVTLYPAQLERTRNA
jgi:hypothetical protein